VDTEFWWGNLKQRVRLVDLDTDGNIVLRCRVESLDCTCFVQDRGKCWHIINAVEKLWVSQNTGKFWISFPEKTLLHGISTCSRAWRCKMQNNPTCC